jgi:hypothetical protein
LTRSTAPEAFMSESSEDSPVQVVHPCRADIRLSDGSALSAIFWLMPDGARPSGVTSLDRLLEGPREFLAVGVGGGGSALLGRDAIETATLPADDLGAPDAADPGASLDVVTLHLAGGAELSGVLQAFSPTGSQRMSDLFNGPERFLAVTLGDSVVLVNKARVARVSF